MPSLERQTNGGTGSEPAPLALVDILKSLQESLEALERWTQSLHQGEQTADAKPTAALVSTRTQALREELAQRVFQNLAAAHRQATAALEEAHQSNQRRLSEARRAADEIRQAAAVAAERTLDAALAANTQALSTAQQHAQELLARTMEQVAQLLGGRVELTPLAPVPTGWPSGWTAQPSQTAPAPQPPEPVAAQPAPRGLPVEAPPDREPSSPPSGETGALAPAEFAQAPVPAGAVPSAGQTAIGGIEIIAGPMSRFSQLAGFMRALRALPGVDSVTQRQFFRGKVYLRVRYDDPISLASRLQSLREFSPRIVAATATSIELHLQSLEQAEVAPESSHRELPRTASLVGA